MSLKKDAYYFAHDSNARNDEKILCLIADFGLEGYGIFWMLIEMMHESTDGTLSHKMIKGLAFKLGTAEGLLMSFVSSCIELELFKTDTEKYWSERVKRNKENKDKKWEMITQKRSDAGKKGMEKRWSKEVDNQEVNNKPITNDNKPDFVNNKRITKHNRKESKVNESKVNNIERVADEPPAPKIENLIEERKKSFTDEIKSYLNTYPREMLLSFLKYWTEKNKSGTKMRYELERTWETSKRLTTWASREKIDPTITAPIQTQPTVNGYDIAKKYS